MAKSKSLSERAADDLYERIVVQKAFAPGARLPSEPELARILGISRTTLREAVHSLVAQGVLAVRRGRGTFVSEQLTQVGDFGLGSLSRMLGRLTDLYEMRSLFEPQAAMLACMRASEAEIENIAALAARVERLIALDGNWPDADQAFHEAIASASHNEFVIQLFPVIGSAVHEIMLVSGNKERLQEITIQDNRTLVEFLRLRDEQGVKAAMTVHILHIRHALKLREA